MNIRKITGITAISIGCILLITLSAALLYYPNEYVYRVLVWQESDAFDWQKFPARELRESEKAFHFEPAADEKVETLLREIADVSDFEKFMEETGTQSLIVLKDTLLLYEGYFNGTGRNSIVTSFSVAKSFTSALIGFAIQDGFIDSVDDPITRYLP
jgi:hypothetical protein